MSRYISTWEPDLHRSAYIAFLKSYLKTRGDKQRFSEQVGITPQMLSYILADRVHPNNPKTFRIPSENLCCRIAETVEVIPEQRERLLEHLLLSREEGPKLRQRRIDRERVREITLEELMGIVARAYEATDPAEYRLKTYELPSFLHGVIQNVSAESHPLIVAQAVLSMCGIENNRGFYADALYYADLTRLILMHFSQRPPKRYEMEWQDTQYGSILAVSIAYANLRLFKSAYQNCEEAKRLPFLTDYPAWQINICTHELKALAGIPRTSIRESERIADNAELLYEQAENTEAALHLSSVYRRLADAYIDRDLYKKAEYVLSNKTQFIPLSAQSPVFQIGLRRAWARLRWCQGDLNDWQMHISSALELGERAGLTAQILEIQKEYGNALDF